MLCWTRAWYIFPLIILHLSRAPSFHFTLAYPTRICNQSLQGAEEGRRRIQVPTTS